MLFEIFYHRCIYLVVSFIFHPTRGSISNLLDYMNNSQFSLQLCMITALAFVPLQNVVNSIDKLCVVIQNQYNEDAGKVLDYFEDADIGCFCRNASPLPRPWHFTLFPNKLWNTFNQTAKELPQINNNIKACQNNFHANAPSTHPTFLKFLDVLLREEGIVYIRMVQNQTGHAQEGTTKMQICWLQCTDFKNCRWLFKPANYGLYTTHCS